MRNILKKADVKNVFNRVLYGSILQCKNNFMNYLLGFEAAKRGTIDRTNLFLILSTVAMPLEYVDYLDRFHKNVANCVIYPELSSLKISNEIHERLNNKWKADTYERARGMVLSW